MNTTEPALVIAARISAVLDENTKIDPSRERNVEAMKNFIKDGKNLPNRPQREVLYAVDGVAGLTSKPEFFKILKNAYTKVPKAEVCYFIVSIRSNIAACSPICLC